MKIRRRTVLLGAMVSGLGAVTRARASSAMFSTPLQTNGQQPVETIELWPRGAPGKPRNPPEERVVERSTDPRQMDRAVTGVTRPRMDVFRPSEPNGAAMLITPGGGYQRVVVDKEGYELGDWLAARGITVFVLFYRLPGDGWAAGPNVALSDAQRSIRLIRHQAGRFGIDPDRVGAMGFSAGGHVCADLATRFDAAIYDAVDDADSLSARPFLAAPIYPVISMSPPLAHAGSRELLIGKNAGPELERSHSPHCNVPASAPPTFLVHAEDDPSVPVGNTIEFRTALRAKGIPVETHLFAQGGHGFGMRGAAGLPAASWPDLFVNWSRSIGFI